MSSGLPVLALAALASLAAILLLLWSVARLHPLLSLVIGLALLAVPVVGYVMVSNRVAHGLGEGWGPLFKVLYYAAYAVVGTLCGFFGLVFSADGIARLARGEAVRGGRRRAAIAVAVAAIAGVLLAVLAARNDPEMAPAVARARPEVSAADAYPRRTVKVEGRYELDWKRRDGAPRFRLALPARFLEQGSAGAYVSETADGPEHVRLVGYSRIEPASNVITLHRGEAFLDERTLSWLDARIPPADPAHPRALWVDRSGGGWRLLGLDCGSRPAAAQERGEGVPCYVPNAAARHVPFAFRLERVRIHVRDHSLRCTITFRLSGRVTEIATPGPCLGERGTAALRDAVQLLDQLHREESAS